MSPANDIQGAQGPQNAETQIEKDLTVHNETDPNMEIPADEVARLADMLAQARAATESEHKMTLMQALKRYPHASAFSILLSFGVVMEGFDLVLLGNFFAYPEFVRTFGELQPDGKYQIPAPWQAGLKNAMNVGSIMGLLYLAEKIGYRYTMIASLVWLSGFLFLFFFAQSLGMLVAAELLCGIPWGILQTLTTSYASEIAPVALRGYLTTWVNACWGIGQLLSVGILRALLDREDQWGWRIPYALQWIWPVPLILVAIFAPESPWWLVRKGRIEDARRSLKRLTTTRGNEHDDFDLENTLSMMQHTHTLELQLHKGATYLECFRGVNLRRTEISVGCWVAQTLCGIALPGESTYFLQSAGLPTKWAFTLTMCKFAINVVGVMVAWTLMASGIGRRSLYLYGCIAMGAALLVIGGVGSIGTTASLWAVGGMLLGWSVCYQFTIGTVCYSLITEMPSRRLLIKTVNIGRAAYNLSNIILGSFTPFMINPSAWNWGTKTAWFAAGFNFLTIIWIFFRLPEPSGLTYAEIDKLFEERVPARKFKKHKVTAVEAQDVGVDSEKAI